MLKNSIENPFSEGGFHSKLEFIHFTLYLAGLSRPGNPISILYKADPI